MKRLPGVDVSVSDGRPVLLPSRKDRVVVVIVEHHRDELRLGEFAVLVRVRLQVRENGDYKEVSKKTRWDNIKSVSWIWTSLTWLWF